MSWLVSRLIRLQLFRDFIMGDLLLLFDRPGEPVFLQKGDDNKLINVPKEYLNHRYKVLSETQDLPNRFGDDKTEMISVKEIPTDALPDLELAKSLPMNARFSNFIPLHQEMANELISVFLGLRNKEDFWSVAVYARVNINPELFNYALSVALLHRPETRNKEIPPLSELFPSKFFDGGLINRMREEANIAKNVEDRVPVEAPVEIVRDYTATDLDQEHRLAYFREDIGVNLHHWHWHLVYPLSGPEKVVKKDRRGELFFYMHQQIIARYNMERLCNNLPRVTRLLNLREPIEEAYFPKMNTMTSTRNWPGRSANSIMRDIARPAEQYYFDIEDLERWRNRLFDAIHHGFVVDKNGDQLKLTEETGIDILGNMVEASSVLSINSSYYGNLHNSMHMAISYIHDPDFRHLESFSVMGDSATAMRDPVFYRVHMMVDDIFQEYKATLNGYPYDELAFTSIRVTGVSVQVEGKEKNKLYTHWQKSQANLSRGMDFTPRGPVYALFTHLQHQPFTYNIEVKNEGSERKGTVRLFIAPKYDERGIPMRFHEQRKLFVEMDRFTADLKAGQHTITRSSADSSVTIPFERVFRNLDAERPDKADSLAKFNFCGCGWPHNMLVAKGKEQGYPCELFVMVSNYADDKVEQELGPDDCMDAMSFCGIRDKLWPDKRAMGFPFDRNARKDVHILKQFLTPNMAIADVSIVFEERVDESKLRKATP